MTKPVRTIDSLLLGIDASHVDTRLLQIADGIHEAKLLTPQLSADLDSVIQDLLAAIRKIAEVTR